MQIESPSFYCFDHSHFRLLAKQMDDSLTHVSFFAWAHFKSITLTPFSFFFFLTCLLRESHFGTNYLCLHFILVHTLHLNVERFPSPSNTCFAHGIFIDHTSWNFRITSSLTIFSGFFLVEASI
jgi:hypothetical protein